MLWGKPETVFSYRLAKLYHKLSLRRPFVMSGIQPFQFLTIPTGRGEPYQEENELHIVG